MGIKISKGTVSVENFQNRIRLRWRHAGKRYSLALFAYNKLNLLQANKIAIQIEQDMIMETFDPSLSKYGKTSNQVNFQGMDFTELFEYWVKNYKQMDCDVHTNYNSTRNMIRKWGRVDANNVLSKMNAAPNAAVTYNRRLTILKSFIDWLVEQKVWEKNPLTSVQRKKVKAQKLEKREPFTVEEIRKILHAFKTDEACSKYTNTPHSFYFPFMYFLFKTGVRNAEAIGLRVKHIDPSTRLIHIKEVLARSLKGTTANERVRKSTKNEKERFLPYTADLEEVLSPLLLGKKPDDLVFLSPKKKPIDDHNFKDRIFKPILKYLNIPERVLYACRHTFGSRCIDQGITPVMTAFLMGNNPETALRRYTHQLNIPDNLPGV